MSCTVAIPNSPVFSPGRVSSSHFRISSSVVSSPEKGLTLTLSPSSSPVAALSSSSPAASPLRLRLQKIPSGLNKVPADLPVSPLSSSTATTLLKRKRPGKLDIPLASTAFGSGFPAAAATPVGPRIDVVEVEGDGYSVYCKRGRRENMEDRYTAAVVNQQGNSKQGFFGVFDGHGGAYAAEYSAKHLEKNISEESFRTGSRTEEEVKAGIRQGYLKTDSEFLKEGSRGGSCCVTAIIRNGNLAVSNAGDCRAVLSRGGIAEALTSDHRPSRDDEKHRIQSLGGFVDCCNGIWRINGSLAVSRGIGDRSLKQWVTADPETRILKIDRDCEFLILASDGLWDKVSNQEAVDIARNLNSSGAKHPLAACKQLAELSVSRGCLDDVSVLLIQLFHFSA
ncbi:probable protein phosphatase 2C 25 [Impatiens glandulifera]|uniref:probable protein phosphatase 2C 25 n=1 Tax=Impatiens glandulifera TaxID=253017 RepID=UPI001FB1323E|nr:probable protein phosphatase 2C 25 [Impatiens glandulifera]